MKTTKQLRTLLMTMSLLIAHLPIVAQSYSTKLLSHEQQIDEIIGSMTLEEKVEMLHGKNMFS